MFQFTKKQANLIPTADSGTLILFADTDNAYKIKNDTGQVTSLAIGTTGAGGAGGSSDISLVASGNVIAYKMIMADTNGQAIYAGANTAVTPLGMAMNASAGGGTVNVRPSGFADNVGWSWPAGARLYLGLSGDITTDPNVGSICCCVGYSITATRIFLNINDITVR
jgi:hypothetical protein